MPISLEMIVSYAVDQEKSNVEEENTSLITPLVTTVAMCVEALLLLGFRYLENHSQSVNIRTGIYESSLD